MVSYSSTRNEDLNGSTIARLTQLRETKTYIIDGDSQSVAECVIYGRSPVEQDFHDGARPPNGYALGMPYNYGLAASAYWDYTSATAAAPSAVGVIFISGAPAGATFQCEVVAHVEYAGRSVNMMATPCTADPTGLSTALSVANNVTISHARTYQKTTRAEHAPSAISSTAVSIMPGASKMMMESKDPRVVAVGQGLSFVSQVVPKKTMARALDEMGSGIRHMFRH